MTNVLTIDNQADEPWNFCLYLRDSSPTVDSLVWNHKFVASGVSAMLQWDPDSYCLCWARTGSLGSGVIYTAYDSYLADPSMLNTPASKSTPGQYAGLTYVAEDDYFTFSANPRPPTAPVVGNLYITPDGTVPDNSASVGWGIGDSPAYLSQATAGLEATFGLDPVPGYWLAATRDTIEPGQIGGLTELSVPLRLDFSADPRQQATFTSSHTWE